MFFVSGVSGQTGSVVAQTLLSHGERVRVLVRDPAKGEKWRALGAEVAVGSLADGAALRRALEGVRGVYLLCPPDFRSTDFLADRRAMVDAMSASVDAAKVPHVVFLSTIGAQHSQGTGILLPMHYGEQRLAQTKAKTTFVRAAYFLENWRGVLETAAGGQLPTFLPVGVPFPMVATRDIGRVAARALMEGPGSGRSEIIDLASGAKDLAPEDVARILSELLSRAIGVIPLPSLAVVPAFRGLGCSPSVAKLYRELHKGVRDKLVCWEGNGARLVRGETDPKDVFRAMLGDAGLLADVDRGKPALANRLQALSARFFLAATSAAERSLPSLRR
jgi:uncharacterized protein YbjT (DUF2867 family)